VKKIQSKFFVLISLLIFSLSAYSQLKIDYNNLKTDVPSDPAIKIGKLENGLKYYIKENKKPEKRAELILVVNAGAILEDEDQNGLAHFCEHMAFNGTKNFPKLDLVNFLESIGVRFGADLNAYTNTDETVYMLTLPTDSERLLNKGFQVLEDWSHNVLYEGKDIDDERGVIREEWRLGKGAEDRIEKKQIPYLFKNSKYEKRDVIGDTAIINNAKYDELRRFYHDWYRPDLMAVIVVGDFDKNDIEKKIKEHFSQLKNPENEKERVRFSVPPNKDILVSVASDKELSMPRVSIYFKHEGRDEKTLESYRQSLVDNLFSEMLTDRLTELTRKPNPPFIYAFAYESRFIDEIRSFTMMGMAKSDGIGQSLESLLKEAFRVYQNGFTESELERAKKINMRRMEKSYDERDKTESSRLAFEYVRNFLDKEPIPGIATELDIDKYFFPGISLDEVNTLTHKLIKNENCVITVAAPDKPGVVVPSDAEVLKMFNNISEEKIEAYSDTVSNQPLLAQIPKPGTVVKEKLVKDIGLTELDLSNGVKVILKPTDFKNDEVSFSSYKWGGSSLASDADYLSAISAASIVNQSGVGIFDRNQLTKMLAGKIVRVNPSIDYLDEEVKGSCSPKDMEVMFQLIYLYFTQPRKDKDAFESYITKLKSQIEDSKNSPRSVMRDTVNVTQFNYNFRKLPWTLESLDKINLDKAVEFYKQRFSNANGFTFFFVGNFDVEKFKPLLLTYLGSLPSNKEMDKWNDRNIEPPKGKIDKIVKKGIEAQSFVWLVLTGDFHRTQKDLFDIEALMDIFDIKVREVLREDKGGVYGVGAWQQVQHFPKDEFKINIVFGCDPKRIDELINAVLDIMNEMKSNVPAEIYMTKVKEIQTRENEVNMKTNMYWLNSIYDSFYNYEDPKRILETEEFIKKLTPDDIRNSANKYFTLNNYIRVVLEPEK
jgi:zinc protease